MLMWLFIIAAAMVVLMVLSPSISDTAMPLGCPACHHGSDDTIAGLTRSWYSALDRERHRVRCRHCGAVFKEHPNGSLVRDPDV